MSLKATIAASLAMIALTTAAQAQTPTRINQFNSWGTYSYDASGKKVCYALSTPTAMRPAEVNHGDIFFLVSQKPNQAGSFEPQVVMGYPMREGSKVTVAVDGTNFTLFVRGESAWIENAADEPKLVAALRAGSSMTVAATSQRGTATNYTYSLAGVTAAINSIRECR